MSADIQKIQSSLELENTLTEEKKFDCSFDNSNSEPQEEDNNNDPILRSKINIMNLLIYYRLSL